MATLTTTVTSTPVGSLSGWTRLQSVSQAQTPKNLEQPKMECPRASFMLHVGNSGKPSTTTKNIVTSLEPQVFKPVDGIGHVGAWIQDDHEALDFLEKNFSWHIIHKDTKGSEIQRETQTLETLKCELGSHPANAAKSHCVLQYWLQDQYRYDRIAVLTINIEDTKVPETLPILKASCQNHTVSLSLSCWEGLSSTELVKTMSLIHIASLERPVINADISQQKRSIPTYLNIDALWVSEQGHQGQSIISSSAESGDGDWIVIEPLKTYVLRFSPSGD